MKQVIVMRQGKEIAHAVTLNYFSSIVIMIAVIRQK